MEASKGMAIRLGVRVVSTIVTAFTSLFMMSSFLTPYGLSPEGASFIPFQSFLGSVPGGEQLSAAIGASSAAGAASSGLPYGSFLPFAAGGGSGFIVWGILRKVTGAVEGAVTSATYQDPRLRAAKLGEMRSIAQNISSNIPATLPPDLTVVQYMILKTVQKGYKNAKDLEKILSVNKREIEKERDTLVTNGYLAKDYDLTSKGLEILTRK